MVLKSVYLSIACGERSRPKPDCLKPPNGVASEERQGNRLNVLCGDVGGEGVFVPCGDFAAHAQRILAFAGSQHVEGAVLDDGEVEGGVVGSHAAFVVAEDHV